jgi:N-acetyl sugar amidotransferase
MYGLPLEVKFCTKCVISNQRPNSVSEIFNSPGDKKETIGFNDDGVCSACEFHSQKDGTDWEQREQELISLLDKHRRPNGYDVVVPGSGGKDSAYTAHILKYKYGMNPLTVTWAPHLYTFIGWENFQNWIHVGGFDNILYTPNGRLHRTLTKLAFENLCHPFQPFIIGQKIIGPMIADKFDIPLIMYGENPTEYGNKIKENNTLQDETQYSSDGSLSVRLGGVTVEKIMKEHKFSYNDFAPYLPLHPYVLREKNIAVHYLGHYLKWDPQECYYYACDNTGFKPNTERTEGSYSKYSSIDDKTDPFHYFTTLIKFGLGRASYDAAQEIRNGKITREEGVVLVHKYDQEFPKKYFKEFLEYISLTEDGFWDIIEKFRSDHLWVKDGSEWKLKNIIQ